MSAMGLQRMETGTDAGSSLATPAAHSIGGEDNTRNNVLAAILDTGATRPRRLWRNIFHRSMRLLSWVVDGTQR